MKISADSKSENYWQLFFADCPVVLVDGVSYDHVREADDEAGYIVVYDYDGDKIKVTPDGNEFIRRRVEGKVELIGARR